MFKFFRSRPAYPPFEALKVFQRKNHYFVRVAQWRWLDKKMITVIDPHGPRVLTMDPWPQLLFLDADGQMTIEEYVYYLAGKYTGAIPARLDETILEELQKIEGFKIIQITDQQQRPEPAFDLPA